MARILGLVGKAVKVVVLAAFASAARVAQARGEGVFENALQNAVAEVAGRYVRSVQNG